MEVEGQGKGNIRATAWGVEGPELLGKDENDNFVYYRAGLGREPRTSPTGDKGSPTLMNHSSGRLIKAV